MNAMVVGVSNWVPGTALKNQKFAGSDGEAATGTAARSSARVMAALRSGWVCNRAPVWERGERTPSAILIARSGPENQRFDAAGLVPPSAPTVLDRGRLDEPCKAHAIQRPTRQRVVGVGCRTGRARSLSSDPVEPSRRPTARRRPETNRTA